MSYLFFFYNFFFFISKASSPLLKTSIRLSSFRSSHPVYDKKEYPNVEIIKNPVEWKFVEKLLSKQIVPPATIKPEYPSGWRPQTIDVRSNDYFIARTKNHMIPIYLQVTFRGTRRITIIKRIQGDIWNLEIELREMIEKLIGRKIASRINEMSGQIHFKGDFVNIVKDYLINKGF